MAVGVSLQIKGLDKVIANQKGVAKSLTNHVMAGFIKGALLVQREAQLLTPVDLGNLKNSGYTVWSKNEVFKGLVSNRGKFVSGPDVQASKLQGDHTRILGDSKKKVKAKIDKNTGAQIDPKVIIGFSAFYAASVHEDLQAKHTVGEAKFLTKALNNNTSKIKNFLNSGAKQGVKK